MDISGDCLPQKDVKPYPVPQSLLDVLNITKSTSVADIVNGFLDLKIKGTPSVSLLNYIKGTPTQLFPHFAERSSPGRVCFSSVKKIAFELLFSIL